MNEEIPTGGGRTTPSANFERALLAGYDNSVQAGLEP